VEPEVIGTTMRMLALMMAVLALTRRAHSQDAPPQAWGLFSARFDTRTSDFIYAAYGYGDTFGMMGVLHNPRSDYSEVLGGVGRNLHFGDWPTQTIALSLSHATESWYTQLYVLPAINRGPLWVRTTSELYMPLEHAGTWQLAFSPISATFAVSRLIEAGIATDLAVAADSKPGIALGPELRMGLPKAALGIDLQRALDGTGNRLRIFFLTSF